MNAINGIKNGMSPKSFYSGSTKKEYLYLLSKKRKRLERENEYIKRPLPKIQIYENCFTERRVWKKFHRQQDALEYCQRVKEKSVCLFSLEKQDGKRSFLVTTRKQFWNRYNTMDPTKKHFYEVIMENNPCRLYFDIEYKYEFNPGLDGCAVTDLFIRYVCHCLNKEFNIHCTPKNVIDMSSSTNTKFSRHLIFIHPKLLFQNNIQCGDFVKEICFSLRSFFLTGSHNKFLPINDDGDSKENIINAPTKDLQDIMIMNEKNEQMFICDLCVYTKNRNFRLYLSSKVSKHVPLVLSDESNRYNFKTRPKRRDMYIKYQMKNLRFDEDFEKFADTLVCPADYKESDILCYGNENACRIVKQFDRSTSQPNNQYKSGVSSLFPDLDKFVVDTVNRNGPKGHIRRWIHYEDRQMIIYDIGDNRWCGNIKREHKSNHIYYVADLTFSQLYQKCHDFECCAYRSEEIPIPKDINPINSETTRNILDDDLMAIFDSDIDFVGKKEDFFNEGDTVLDEEILKLSTTSMFENTDSTASNRIGDASPNAGNSSTNPFFSTFNSNSERSNNASCGSSTFTTLVNDTIDEDINIGSSDDEIFLDKSLSFTEDNVNQESVSWTANNVLSLNSPEDLFGNSQTWSDSLVSQPEFTEDADFSLRPPQFNSIKSDLNYDSELSATSSAFKPNEHLNVLDSKNVVFSSSQENTLNKFFEEDFSFD
eukprot:TCONS_00033405-protein